MKWQRKKKGAKFAPFSGHHATAKALASLEKTNETVRGTSDFCTSVEKVKELMKLKGWNEFSAAENLGISQVYFRTCFRCDKVHFSVSWKYFAYNWAFIFKLYCVRLFWQSTL
jgi:hypothetical protein